MAGARQVFGTMLPKGLEGSDRRGVVDLLKEAAQSLAFRAAVLSINRIVDVDVQLRCEEFRETRIRKPQDVTTPANEVDEVVDQAQVDRS